MVSRAWDSTPETLDYDGPSLLVSDCYSYWRLVRGCSLAERFGGE